MEISSQYDIILNVKYYTFIDNIRNMKKINTTLYIAIFYSLLFCPNLFAANPIDYVKGKFAMDKGNSLLAKGNYDNALKEYEKAKGFLQESDILYYNIANTFLKKGDYMGSTMAYEYAKKYMSEKTSDKLKSDIYYNSAINNIEMEKYAEAITDLIEALKVQPKNNDTISALEYARKRLKEQQQEQSNSSNDQQEKDQSGNNNNDEQDDNSNNNNENNQERDNQVEQTEQDNSAKDKASITQEEAKRILDALRNDRDDSEDTRQNYKGGRRIENDW